MQKMRIGLWNIDHPETGAGVSRKEKRFFEVTEYLIHAQCDAYIITEANAAIELPGYYREFSKESPFRTKRRFYGKPNSYHQVGIYSIRPIQQLEVTEPINSLLCKLLFQERTLLLYGNVITIKDQWSESSPKTYSDRLDEQVSIINTLPTKGMLIGGDFNLRLGWPQKQFAHRKMKEQAVLRGLLWPTETRDDTVQHVLHSKDLRANIALDFSVKYQDGNKSGLSDHPFVTIELSENKSTLKNNNT
jgi:hypothetical protein